MKRALRTVLSTAFVLLLSVGSPAAAETISVVIPTTSATATSGTVAVSGTSTAVPTSTATPTSAINVSGESSSAATQAPDATGTAIEVLPTSGSSGGDLSYTGLGFNLPLTLGAAVIVILAGFALVALGRRRRDSRAAGTLPQH